MDNNSPSQSGNRVIIIAIVTALVLAVIAGGVFAYLKLADRRSAEEKLTDALFEAMEAERGEIRTVLTLEDLRLDVDDTDAAMIADILRDMEMVSRFRYDIGTRQMEGSLDLEIMGTKLLGGDMYLDREYLMLDVPLLYDRPLYMSTDALFEMLQEQMMDNLMGSMMMGTDPLAYGVDGSETIDANQIETAVDILIGTMERDSYDSYELIDQVPYKVLVTAYLLEQADTLEEKDDGITYVMGYDREDTVVLAENLLEQLLEDTKAMAFLEEVINRLFDRVIEEKNWILYHTLMNSSDGKSGWQDGVYEGDLENRRQMVLERLEGGIETLATELEAYDRYGSEARMAELEDSLDISVGWQLDGDNRLREQSLAISLDLSQMTMTDSSVDIGVVSEFSELNGTVAFDGVDFQQGVDLGAMDDDELMTLFMEIQDNVFANVMNNPMFSDLFYLQ